MSAAGRGPARSRDLLALGAVALVYALAHQLGFRFLSPVAHVSALWPASGVAVAALLLSPRRLWAAMAGTIGAVSFLSNLAGGNPLPLSVGYALSNLVELGAAAWVFGRYFAERVTFNRVREVLALLAVATLGTALAAVLGALTATQADPDKLDTAYVTWWISNSLGILLVTPLCVSFAPAPWRDFRAARVLSGVGPRRALEAVAFFACWCAAAWLAFSADHADPLAPRPYALIALLAWAALRFGQRGVSLSLGVLGVLAIGSASSVTELSSPPALDPTEQLLAVQIYLAITAVTGLLLAASATETRAAEQLAREGRGKLRVLSDNQQKAEQAAQTSAERLRFALKAANMGTWEWVIGSDEVLWSDQVDVLFGLERGSFPGTFAAYIQLIHAEDRERVGDAIKLAANAQVADFVIEHRVIWPDGSLRWVEGKGRVHRDEETGRVRMIGTIVDVSERKLANTKLKSANRALRTLSNCNQALVHARTEAELLQEVCRVIVEDGGYRLAWVGFAEGDPSAGVRVAARASQTGGAPEASVSALPGDELSSGSFTNAVRSGEPVLCRKPDSSLVVPLKSAGGVFGAVSVHASDANGFDAAEIELLTELSEDLSYGIQTLRGRIDQERAEAAAAAGEALLRQFIKHTPAAVAMLDTEMRYLYAAERWILDYHLQGQEIIGRSHYDVFPDIPEDWRAVHRRVLAGSVEKCDEDPFPRADGTIEWLAWEVRPWRKAGGEIGGLIMFTQVITARKQAEESVRRSEDRFRRLIENASDMITVLNNQGVIRFQSPSSERVLGLSPEQLMGRSVFELLHPDDVPLVTETLRNVEQTPAAPATVKIRLRHNDDSWRLVECIGRSVPDEAADGYLVVNARDITEGTMLQEQLRQTQKLEALGTLAGGIAHDFNNILSAIISFTELAQMDNPENEELQDNLKEVLKACSRAANLVSQILSFSRQQKQERRKMSLTPVLGEVLRLLRSTLPSTIEISKAFESDLPYVLADATQLHQVLMNLCTNAAHAMGGRGKLRVTLASFQLAAGTQSPHPELAPGEYLRLEVGDTGHGMDAALVGRIFEPFFTTKQPGEGTGLGLSVVHGIIKDHDGVISVESMPARGTTFRIYLPAIRSEAREEPDTALVGVPRGRGERVLFVDDEPALCDVAERILLRLGYLPVVHKSSEQAFEALQRDPDSFAVVLTDLTMPNMTGVDLITEIQKLRPGLPIVLTSGYTGTLTSEAIQELNIREVIHKPLDYRALGLAVARCCGPGARLGLDASPQVS